MWCTYPTQCSICELVYDYVVRTLTPRTTTLTIPAEHGGAAGHGKHSGERREAHRCAPARSRSPPSSVFFWRSKVKKIFILYLKSQENFLKVQKNFLDVQKIFPHLVFFLNLRFYLTVCVFWNDIVWICDHLRIEKCDPALQNRKNFRAARAQPIPSTKIKHNSVVFCLIFARRAKFFWGYFRPNGENFSVPSAKTKKTEVGG